ncbi:hypothetical protein [Micromonospora psammae]|uniref:hypothetical protein n=1 Tax=Micromonospora sp. CPCC 205556 TaxID=3122398 RepID=UPI002FF02147
MSERSGLTRVAYFVLRESGGDAPLPEIADAWRNTADAPPTVEQAVPALAAALAALAAEGLVEVRRFATWPQAWSGGAPVAGEGLCAEAAAVGTWLPGPARTGLMVARITDSGKARL